MSNQIQSISYVIQSEENQRKLCKSQKCHSTHSYLVTYFVSFSGKRFMNLLYRWTQTTLYRRFTPIEACVRPIIALPSHGWPELGYNSKPHSAFTACKTVLNMDQWNFIIHTCMDVWWLWLWSFKQSMMKRLLNSQYTVLYTIVAPKIIGTPQSFACSIYIDICFYKLLNYIVSKFWKNYYYDIYAFFCCTMCSCYCAILKVTSKSFL